MAPATQPDLAKIRRLRQPQRSRWRQRTPQMAQEKPAQAAKDSNAAKTPTELPEGLYHMVGGNNP